MKTIACFIPALLLCINLLAQKPFTLKVSGVVSEPLQLTMEDLNAMPGTTALLQDRDGKSHTYSGVPVSAILTKAGVPTGKALHGENLSKYLLVTCADGYQVLFSLAELDSSFTDKKVILAYKADGVTLPPSKGPLRLVAEGEKRPARSSYQVVALAVRSGRER